MNSDHWENEGGAVYRPPDQITGPEPPDPKPKESKYECEIPENLFLDQSRLVE